MTASRKNRSKPTRALTRGAVAQPSLPQSPKGTQRGDARLVLGRARGNDALFPVPAPVAGLPHSYARTLNDIKERIGKARLSTVLKANAAAILLYWEVGKVVAARMEAEQWGAKVIDRLAADIRTAYPDMSGFSSRNLQYMRAFATNWTSRPILQQLAAKLPWGHHMVLLDALDDQATRCWYAAQAIEHGWSRSILSLQIGRKAHGRHGRAANNFRQTLPPSDSDFAAQVFKDPYLFDFLGTADPRRGTAGLRDLDDSGGGAGWRMRRSRGTDTEVRVHCQLVAVKAICPGGALRRARPSGHRGRGYGEHRDREGAHGHNSTGSSGAATAVHSLSKTGATEPVGAAVGVSTW